MAEVLALLVALATLTSPRSGWWRFFTLFMALTLGVEITGFYVHYILNRPNNYNVFVPFMLVEACFYTLILYKFLDTVNLRRWLLAGFGAFLLVYIFDLAGTNFMSYSSTSRISLSVFVVLFSCIYYRRLLQGTVLLQPLKYPPFWVVTGLFFFYFGTIVVFCFRSQLIRLPDKGANVRLFLLGALNWILYLSWSIAFIWKRSQIRLSKAS
ncbi:MAG TPA: hypothetical protein VNV35_00150 [Puia sp.]|nr:hypothetical protein [Puia sp.]